MAKKKKKLQNQKDLCLFVVQVPRNLKLAFRKACCKQGSSAKNAIELLMRAVIDKQITFNKGLKFTKKSK